METQQSVFGGHTRGDHAGLQPRGEGTKYTWLEAASGRRPVTIGPRTSTSTPCVCVGGSEKKARVHCVPFCGEKVAADQACIATTVFSSLRPIQVLRLILGSCDIGMQRSRTRLVAWRICSAHPIYLERLAAEMQYAWVLVVRSYVLFRATFVISKSH
jgi:hypothetical protein